MPVHHAGDACPTSWITAEYFDVGQRRVLPLARRPPATALVAAIADSGREFDPVVMGDMSKPFTAVSMP